MSIIISDTEPRVQYTATAGQTSFTVGFEFFDNADLKVFNGTSLLTFSASPTNATQYSVSGAGQTGGGSITLGSPGATVNDIITISRDVAIQRVTDFPTSGAFQIGSLNTELDKIIAMCQQLERDLKFSPRAAATTSNTFDITFPNLAANKVLSVNSAGNGLEFSQNITDITTIAGIASAVSNVSSISSAVSSVSSNSTNINLVASNIGSVNTVAADIAKVIAVANDLAEAVSEVETVADDLNEAVSEIDTVANNITDVNTVGNATNINNITLVAGQISPTNNISTVAGINTEITTVANANSNITTIATDLSGTNTIGTVATNLSGSNTIGTVATNITDVQDVADNIIGVNSFAERYRVDSSDPSTSLDAGDLVYNTSANALKYYDGSSWNAIVSGGVTSITAGTGLSGGAITSSGTIAIDTATTVDKTTAQTLTNKTLTLPKINENVALTSTATELNLLDGVSGLVQADFTKLAAIDASAAEIDTLDGLSRGSIIYGNASAATAILTKGTAGQVLTSDGTDISWSNAASGGTDWQSAVKTSNFTAVAGEGYWINTSSNAVTMTLPSSASVGDEIEFVDYSRSWGTNNCTVALNSLKFQGGTVNPVYDKNGQAVRIVYSGTTNGWIPTSDEVSDLEGIITYNAEYLVVAGGGSGGSRNSGGGGAGGHLTNFGGTAISLQASNTYTVTVGAGGSQPPTESQGNDGDDSVLSGAGITTITAIGGGGGGGSSGSGNAGGSGGGAGSFNTSTSGAGTSGQGNNGGVGFGNANPYSAGGGGGASASGGNGTSGGGGAGGAGLTNSITGSSVTRAGGGGGNAYNSGGAGGAGGGGSASASSGDGNPGTANTGGGGGGNRLNTDQGGAGGSGVVVLRVPTANYSGTTTGSPTVTTSGSDTIMVFNGSGSYTA